jgi:hypothetical protein
MGYYLPNKSYLRPSQKAKTSQKLLAITTATIMLVAFSVIFTSLQFGDSETALADIPLKNHSDDYVRPANTNEGAEAVSEKILPANSDFPVTLGYMNATMDIHSVKLEWLAIAEFNNNFYTIEKSKAGGHFTEIGVVQGAGTDDHSNQYSFLDKEPGEGIIFYRLKQTSYNGYSSYIGIDKVVKNNNDINMALYIDEVGPQPFEKYFNIHYYSQRDGGISVELFNKEGKNIYKTYTTANKGYNTCRFIDADRLIEPEYTLRIANSTGVYVKKIKRKI